MTEQATGFLDQFGTLLVLGYGLLYLALAGGAAYTLQAISDKTEAAPSWMAWVPFVQMHPFIRAAGTSWTAILAWVASMIAMFVFGAMLSSNGSPGTARFLALLFIVGSFVYFGRMMWRLAENRDCSGWVGLACFIPLLGLLFYLYIAFHDGPVRPSPVGLVVTAVLAALGAWSFSADLTEARATLGAFEAHQGILGPDGPESEDQGRALLESLEAALQENVPAEVRPPAPKEQGPGGSAGPGLLGALTSWARDATTPRPAYPEDIEIPRQLECDPGTVPRGAAPPRGFEAWCEDPLTGTKQGWYLSWHPNGRRDQAGRYVDGQRQGTWTRFWEIGGRRAQVNFEDGEEHGMLVMWDQLGNVERETPYVEGEPRPY